MQDRKKYNEKLARWQTNALTELLDVFDLPRPSEGNKEHKIDRVIEFLENPQQMSDKDLAAQVSDACMHHTNRCAMQLQPVSLWWLHGGLCGARVCM